MTLNPEQLLSARVQSIKPSPTLAISARAEELQATGKPILNLSIGEPDFDTPEHIKEAAILSLQEGHTKYTAVEGTKKLRQAIVDKFARENQLKYELNQILVSSGAKQSLYNLFIAILNPGDEVIIPAPYWVSYPDMVKLTEGKPVIVDTSFKNHFKMTADELAQGITPKTRAIILNSPSNPTGMVYTADELKKLADVLLNHPNIIIASDDIYERHCWNHLPFKNIMNVCPELSDRTIVINGASKTYAMTGWRIGYAAGPAKIIAAMKKAQSQSTSNPNSIAQDATIAALNSDQTCVTKMCHAYKDRHDFVISELQKMKGIEVMPSDGTFYTFPLVSPLFNPAKGINNDLEFAEYLLNKAEIAIIPGSAFGAPGHIRICYTTSMENLKEAMKRLHQVVKELT